MKKSLSLFLALSLVLCIPVFGAEATFTDVPAGLRGSMSWNGYPLMRWRSIC